MPPAYRILMGSNPNPNTKKHPIAKAIGCFWQRMRDSNPRKRSQSPVCYRYTNPLYGGDNRTRTCDLMRVKHRRAYRPDQRRSNQPKPVGNQRLFVVSQSRQDDKHQSLTSCLHADGIVAHPTSKVKTIERLFIIFS